MSKAEENKDINPDDLPQKEVFQKKEVFQHPQPADQGLPLKPGIKDTGLSGGKTEKEEDKTSKSEGLNEANSAGTAGAFEGLEDQQQ